MKLSNTYKIETERLIVRCYDPGDAAKLQEAIAVSLDHLSPWMPWISQEVEGLEGKLDRIRIFRGEFDLGKDYVFGIFNKSDSKLIGSTGLHTRIGEDAREIGYWISVQFVRQGYALEAVRALIKIGFEIEELNRIEIHCNVHNFASQAIPKKLGFKLDAVLKSNPLLEGETPKETMIWVLSKPDYEKSGIKDIKIKAFDIAGKELSFRD
jgi:RimJ/RimL family protein N-acetyltransferase